VTLEPDRRLVGRAGVFLEPRQRQRARIQLAECRGIDDGGACRLGDELVDVRLAQGGRLDDLFPAAEVAALGPERDDPADLALLDADFGLPGLYLTRFGAGQTVTTS
jgi:hypothetical protein